MPERVVIPREAGRRYWVCSSSRRAAVRHPFSRSEAPDSTLQKRLRLVAQALVNRAIGGDVMACREMADKLDGKPAQAVALSGDEEGTEPLQIVIRTMVDASGKPLGARPDRHDGNGSGSWDSPSPNE